MRTRLASLGLAATLALSAACGTAAPPPPAPCAPACREGFTCVSGRCVSSCNPACAPAERCDTSGSVARCVASDGGGSSPDSAAPDAAPLDATSPTDASALDGTSPADASALDGTSPTDASALDATPPSDAGALDAGALDARADAGRSDAASAADAPDARPACGMPGQPCCGRYCAYGATCEIPTGASVGTCRAFAPQPGECVGPTTCAMANARCRVGIPCGDRRCILCTNNPAGATRRLGEACASTDECESGFCFVGRCSTLCHPGAAGDAACAAMLPRGMCGAGTSSVSVPAGDGGLARASVLSFGACRAGCAREADCPSGDVCAPSLNDPADRVDFVCRTPSAGLLPGGAACTDDARCASGVCVTLGGGASACFRPCTVAADCPASAPSCVDMLWVRPSGGSQPGRTCAPR